MKAPGLVVAALTLGGCVATMQGAYIPAQDMDVSWFGRDQDRVRPGGLASPDGVLDGHFRIDLDLPVEEEIRSVGVFQTTPAGDWGGIGYGIWHSHSDAGLNWIVGVFDGDRQVNSAHVSTLGRFKGRTSLDIFIAENDWVGHLRSGNHVVIEVTHGNGKTSKKLVDLSRTTVARAAAPTTPRPEPLRAAAPAPSSVAFPSEPAVGAFRPGPAAPDDIAVVIGNADYARNNGNIPDVKPAHADAEGFKRWAMESQGVRPGNVIDIRDATSARMIQVFGSKTDHRGKLFDWVKPGISRVYVYYAGHGAPGEDGHAYLVPTDAEAARIKLVGYPLGLLYDNLAQLPARSVTVVIEACFSGISQAGTVISNASPVYLKAAAPAVPSNLTIYTAGSADQLASWDESGRHSLFTKYFLKGMNGEADARPYGDGDGRVSDAELDAYLRDTLTYYARRYYGRDQQAQIRRGAGS